MQNNSLKLYFEDTGTDKPPLLLIAGLASDAISWTFQMEALAAEYRLITFDNRGVGRSPKPPGPYSIPEMAADVLKLLDHLEIQKVHILGHSMGGAIAQHLAITAPERVEKLILACTFSKLEGRSVPVVESWAGILRLGASPELVGQALFPWLYTEKFLSTPGTLEACQQALAQHPYPLEGDAITAQVAALRSFDSTAELSQIQAPCLVLAAAEDLLVSPKSAKALADAIAHAQFREVPNTAHSLMLETPDAFNETVLDYLRQG